MTVAQQLGRVGWWVMLVSLGLSVLGGAFYAVVSPSGGRVAAGANLGVVTGRVLIMVPVLVGLAGLASGGRRLLRSGRRESWAGFLLFVGPLAVVIGMELVPHLINPCLAESSLGMCEEVTHRGGFNGTGEVQTSVDITDRWHALHHGLIGAVPMTIFYGLALRRWNPQVLSPRAASEVPLPVA